MLNGKTIGIQVKRSLTCKVPRACPWVSTLFLPVLTWNTTPLTITVSPFLKNLFLYTTIAFLLLYTALHIKKYNNDLGFSLFIILSLLLSPLCWDHCLTLLLLSFAILIKELIKRNNKYEIVIFLTSLLLISINIYSVWFTKIFYITHFYLLDIIDSQYCSFLILQMHFGGLFLLNQSSQRFHNHQTQR